MSTKQGFDDLWEEAVDKYIESTGRTPSEQALLGQLKSPDDLEKQLETEHGKFASFRAKHGKLTGRLKKAIRPFTVLSSVASSAISLSPFAPASTILGAVVFIVKAADGVSGAYDWIDQLFDKLGDFTVRLDEYCKEGISPHLGMKAVQILGCLLEILAHSEKTIKIGRWRKYAAEVFLGNDEKIKASFEKLVKLFEDEHRLVSAIILTMNQRMDKRIEEIEKTGKHTFEAAERVESDKIFEWLSSTDFPAKQSDFIARRQDGTGKWFLDSPEFTKWLCTPKEILFCPGIPGAGKTMMAAITIDHLLRTTRSDSIGIAYIYCNYKEQADQDTASLLATILKQLAHSGPSIPEPVSRLYEHHSRRRTRPSSEEIFSALQSVLRDYSAIYVVVDSLDECPDREGTRSKILNKIRDLQKETDLHLMVTSRFIPEIEEEFKHAPRLEVRATAADVKRFVAGKIHELPKCIQRDKELQELVQDRITQAVDGMFLLARLYVESLRDKTNVKKVKGALQKFSKGFKSFQGPRDLDQAYQEAYDEAYADAIERIDSQLPGKAEAAKRAISWIIYAERSFKTWELCHALAVELGTEELDPENIDDVEDIVSFCAGLVTVDEESNIIRLVHYTTQEYFERIRETWIPNAQQEITSACLTYLSFSTFRSGSCSSDEELDGRLEQYVFLDYAARYWGHHARTVQEKVYKLASSFLQNGNLVSCAFQTMSILEYRWSGYSQNFPKQATGLHLAARFGLFYLLEKLLAERGNVEADSKDSNGRTPLSWAAENGHEAVVKLLLAKNEVDPDSKDKYEGRTPLWWAAEGGHETTVKLLLAKDGVDPDSKDKYERRTPLSWAVENEYEAMVKLLLAEDRVDPDSKDKHEGRTPLSWAAESGHETAVRLLLAENGVDPDSKDKYERRTPLSWAAENGCEAVIKLLLAKDAVDPDSKDINGRTPLSWAAKNGHETVVKLLLAENGIDPDFKDHNGWTPLSRAAKSGHETVIKLLLAEDRVDPDFKDMNGQTSLSWAAENGHEAAVKLLLAEDGVDPDSKDYREQTPLSRAAENGHGTVVKLLLAEDGVDPDSKDMNGHTPLSWAAGNGHEVVIKLLLAENGVDPDSKNNRERTPLSWAAKNGHEAVIKLLLAEDGVDPDSKDRNGQTPLSRAAESGHEAVVKLLLAKDRVDPDSKDNNGHTPLSWAARNGHEAVIKLLQSHDSSSA